MKQSLQSRKPLLYKYDYCPLLPNRRSLRLLHVKPGNDFYTLRAVDIETDPASTRYRALSWCWEEEKTKKTYYISILHENHKYQFEVSSNLYAALERIREHVDERGRARDLWVDAICINQNSPPEKNEQVPMMATIYGKAHDVFVWLGESRANSDRAMRFIADRVLNLNDFDRLVTDESTYEEWKALADLMKRKWFSRRWVVQEIALARQAWVWCGSEKVNWKDLADTIRLFNVVESGTRSLSQVMRKQAEFRHMPDFFRNLPAFSATRLVEATSELFRNYPDGTKDPLLSLEHLVSTFSPFQASEPRDTVYALLAIARDTVPSTRDFFSLRPQEAEKLAPIRDLLKRWGKKHRSQPYNVDYAQPIFEIFKDFLLFSIAQSEPARALDMIGRPWVPNLTSNTNTVQQDAVGFDQDTDEEHEGDGTRDAATENPSRADNSAEDLPTWMPRLSSAAFAMDVAGQKVGRKNADSLVGLPTQQTYRAAGLRRVTNELRFEDGVVHHSKDKHLNGRSYHSLFVEGFILDSIEKRETASQHGNIPYEWRKLGGWDEGKEPEDFWRTLVADRGPNGSNAPGHYPRLLKHALGQGIDGDALNTSDEIHYGNCDVVGDLLRRVQAVIWNRRLIRTGRNLLGLVPERAKEGDFIAILYGCTVPVVLRRFEKTVKQAESEDAQRDARLKLDPDKIALAKKVASQIRLCHERRQAAGLRQMSQTTSNDAHVLPGEPSSTGLLHADKSNKRLRGRTSVGPSPKRLKTAGVAYLDTKSSPSTSRASSPHPRLRAPDFARKYGSQGKLEKLVYYDLIGEAYVHGMMNGEAIEWQSDKANDVRLQVFEIR